MSAPEAGLPPAPLKGKGKGRGKASRRAAAAIEAHAGGQPREVEESSGGSKYDVGSKTRAVVCRMLAALFRYWCRALIER